MKKIIFMGTPFYATCILKALVENDNFELLALFTQPDKAVGRKQTISPSHTKAFLSQHCPNIPIFTPSSLQDENIVCLIKNLNPDFIVVAAYGKILPKAILDITPCINLHASLLPKYRGASPIQSAILNKDDKSGVCTMLMQEGLDTGDVLESIECNIKDKNSIEVFELLAHLAAKLILTTLLNFDKIIPIKQDENLATLCKKIKKEDGLVNLENAREVYQKYLAFTPWPGIFLENGLKFLELDLVDEFEKNLQMGQILTLEKESFLLSCKQGIIRVKKIQESGKKALDGRTYLNGKRLKSADYLC
ncbi:methionyl-tRNA formyltransferase [Campylobacter hepaticus]|uniref:methionyl-tRNA formyltransferase n=1 Tax=Campylobacter hepaticus TaxID=1813019 RepID=UPI0029A22ACD|nr:methionyl-tRNA formyltransferase [Campylobacter hepaticus]MDX2331270.1 methionyl-tRNA formyltransferase [Campylobacter hepaticus]MDX2371885.1 methionyl-tRNA formyltransferase [Campylobacter hepaticus]MDX2397379.1 methionyl-tRNA formyltransferase [Campylobacter hepaticus]MDX5509043.1 methionyl-tRNA formyltransferase [Campylobacter hepaticus]